MPSDGFDKNDNSLGDPILNEGLLRRCGKARQG